MRSSFSAYLQWAVVLAALVAGFVLGQGSKREKIIIREPASTRTGDGQPKKPGSDPNSIDPGAHPGVPELIVIQKDATVVWPDAKNNRLMTATAKEIGWNESNSVGYALGLSATLYENGKKTAHITAPRAEVYQKEQILLATGGVTMKSLERRTTLKSKWVKWFAKEKKAIGNGGVQIDAPDMKGSGAAFVADTTLKTFKIMNSAKGLEP